ncbi:MAG: hypothetical protein K0R38_4307 [Polyangiaceae bacterium]|nr:hypothetical protein [Polyangiaceae bacterium]
MGRAVLVSRCIVGALALACSRIDDGHCVATRTCPRGLAGQGGDSGGAPGSAGDSGGVESDAAGSPSGGCKACEERAR